MKIWLPRLTPKLSFSSLTISQKTASSELRIWEDRKNGVSSSACDCVLKASTQLQPLQPSCHSPERKKSKITMCCTLRVPSPLSSTPISLFEEILCFIHTNMFLLGFCFFLCGTDPGHTTTIYSKTLLAGHISILKTETKPASWSSQLGKEELLHEPSAKAPTEISAIQWAVLSSPSLAV